MGQTKRRNASDLPQLKRDLEPEKVLDKGAAVVETYDFSGIRILADIGGIEERVLDHGKKANHCSYRS
jgi:hypothetical protein